MRVRFLFWVCLFAAIAFFLAIHSYQTFTSEELVAIVECQRPLPDHRLQLSDAAPRSSGQPNQFRLIFTPVMHGKKGIALVFPMHGEQWTVGGDILKWHPWVNLIGVKNCHRLSRLSSRYDSAEKERTLPRSVYPLNGGSSLFWQWLYRRGRWIPFVEAVYGNSAYCFAEIGARWGVYVALSGYLVKPLRSE